jgi:MOSC domain-containing protein YiiM
VSDPAAPPAPEGRVLSLRTGRAEQVFRYRGKDIRSGFLKQPVDGRVALGPLGLDGDE